MTGLLTALAPALVSIFGFVLERVGASIETKKSFLRFVERLSYENVNSVRLHKSYEEQRRKLGVKP